MNKLIKYIVWPIILLPAAYLAIAWNNLPEKVPMHYNLKGEVDRYGNKMELLWVMVLMIGVNIGVYLLLVNIHRIDPKKKYSESNRPGMKRLAFLVSVFVSVLACFIVYSSLNDGMKFDSRFVAVGVGLLFTAIGNYMYTIKPNYFAGIRTPWTLESEENWRLTHKLGGRLWFVGGLVLAITALLVPGDVAFIVMLVIVSILAIIPIIYSWRIYAKTKK